MIDKPDACRACSLFGTGTGFVLPEGMPLLGVTLIGEAAGENEAYDGKPFRPYAQGGSILERAIRRNGYSRGQFRILNVLQCQPPGNFLSHAPYEFDAINKCAVHRNHLLRESVEAARSQPGVAEPVILALGDIAFRTLTGLTGEKQTITHMRGYPIYTPFGLVVGTLHPAYIRRDMKQFGVLVHDLELAVRLARDGFHPLPLDYLQHPTVSQVQDFRDKVLADPWLTVSFDIETLVLPHFDRRSFPQITSVQFSLAPATGIYLPWNLDTIPVIRDIMNSPNMKAGHNCWSFDVPALEQYGAPAAGVVHDTLWMYHHYQPDLSSEETRGESEDDAAASLSTRVSLQPVASFFGMDFPWKHKNESEPEFYGIADVDAVQRIMTLLPPRMKDMGIWEGYDRKVRQLRPILAGAERRGLPIDEDARLSLKDVLRGKKIELDELLQRLYPHELKGIEPKNGYTRYPVIKKDKIRYTPNGLGYEWYYDPTKKASKKSDKEENEHTSLAKEGPLAKWLPLERRTFSVQSKRVEPCKCASDNFIASGSRAKKPTWKKYAQADCPVCLGKGKIKREEKVTEERWVKVKPFKPSKQQLIKYMTFMGHKIPKDLKDKTKTTTAAQRLKEHAKKYKDPLYQGVLDSRTVDKMDSTYVEGYAPSNIVLYDFGGNRVPIGTVHTEFTFAPATGQLSSRGPNIQNAPKHTRNKNLAGLELPARFRRMVRARPGHRLWGFDYKSAHALTLGFEAKDPDYMRLARLDIHSYLTSVLVGRPIDLKLSDADLKLALADVKKHYQAIRDTQAKPAILGYGFGLGAYKLHDQNKAEMVNGVKVGFNGVKDAQLVIDMLNATFPRTAQFRTDIKTLAHKQHFLISAHGFIRWFWDVFNFLYDADSPTHYQTLHGTDTEDSIAFLPANDAFGHIRDAMLVLEEEGLNEFAYASAYNIGGFINNEHDALKFEIPLEIEDDVVPRIKAIMEAPSKILVNSVAPNGLFIEVEAERGFTWADMEKVRL